MAQSYSLNEDDFPFTRNLLDIDVFYILDQLKIKFQKAGLTHTPDGEPILDFLSNDEKYFIKLTKKDFPNIHQGEKQRSLIIPSNHNLYYVYLAWKIIEINSAKIFPLLTFQSKQYKGNYYQSKNNFVALIEYDVFDFIQGHNFLNDDKKLEKIMEWVELNRNVTTTTKQRERKRKTEKVIRTTQKANSKKPPKVFFFQDVTIDKKITQDLYEGLKIYFPKQLAPLKKLIIKGHLVTGLCYNSNINSLVELFKRMRYNHYLIVDSFDKLSLWIESSFTIRNEKNEPEPIKLKTIKQIFSKFINEPPKGKRILGELFKYQKPDNRTYKKNTP